MPNAKLTNEFLMNDNELTLTFTFLQHAENLKSTLRSAHTATGRHESAAEHTWRLCLMLLVFDHDIVGSQAMDRLRLLQMAVIHDLAEAVTGDVPAIDQHNADNKASSEKEAIGQLTAMLPEGPRDTLLALWEEYENGSSPEARFLKGFDKLETILQHNQGRNPPDFDYAFNLRYGQEYMTAHPLLATIREHLDKVTQANVAKQHQ